MKTQIVDIMLDLETLGNQDSPVIIQLSAVPFNLETGEVQDNIFNKLINPMSSVKRGLQVNSDTVEWWLKQPKSVVEKVFSESIISGGSIEEVLMEFSEYLKQFPEVRVYGNGIMADNRWLESAYLKTGIKNPIKYWEHNDVRTIVDLGIRILNKDIKKETEFVGEKHNAIDDCKHQIKYCCEIVQQLKGKL